MSEIHIADTPIAAPTFPRASRVDQTKGFVGDLARPFAIIATSGAAAVAVVKIAWAITDANAGAIYIGAVFVGVGALYAGKSWENVKAGQQATDVAVAKATSPNAS